MSSPPAASRQVLVSSWVAQMIGTIVLCSAVIVFAKSIGRPAGGNEDWKRYAMIGVVVGIAPALLYLRRFKAMLLHDERLERERGTPEPAARNLLRKGLAVGGALCEIPMAMGVVQLFFGGETRWFLGATLVTIALRLSYRPFLKTR